MENEAPERKEEQVQEAQTPVTEAPPPPASPPVSEPIVEVSHEERLWATACHLVALAGYVLPALGFLIAPLILWLIKREGNPYVDSQGKEAVNFQISILIYLLASVLLMVIGIGFFLLPVIAVFDFVMIIVAAIKANGGEDYRYPLCIRLVK